MKKLLSVLLIAALLLALTACGAGGGDTSVPEPSADAHYPVTLTDQAGRTVTIEKAPQRLVSGYYISTSLLIALGLEEQLVGVEAKADKRAIYRLAAPALMELPSVGTAKEFDMEGCLALSPDLVILPLKLKSAAETLAGMGIDALVVNPESRDLLNDMIELIAAATGTEARAAQLRGFTDTQQVALAALLEGAAAPRVYLAGNSSLLSTAGGHMYQSDMITLAGGTNVAADIDDTYWTEIGYEQLLAWDPDCIVLASDATYTADDVLSDPNLGDCAAVKNGRVYQLPGKAEAWDSPVPSGILGSLWLASVLHPDRLSAADCAAIIDDYYTTFYGFTYSEQ